MKSILTGNITTLDRKALQRMIKTSQNILGTPLQSLSIINEVRYLNRAQR